MSLNSRIVERLKQIAIINFFFFFFAVAAINLKTTQTARYVRPAQRF